VWLSLTTFDSASGSFPYPYSRELNRFWGKIRANILFLKIQRERVVCLAKARRIRMVQKAFGGAAAKSLKTEAGQNRILTGPQRKGFGPSAVLSLEDEPHLLLSIGEFCISQPEEMGLIPGPVVGWKAVPVVLRVRPTRWCCDELAFAGKRCSLFNCYTVATQGPR